MRGIHSRVLAEKHKQDACTRVSQMKRGLNPSPLVFSPPATKLCREDKSRCSAETEAPCPKSLMSQLNSDGAPSRSDTALAQNGSGKFPTSPVYLTFCNRSEIRFKIPFKSSLEHSLVTNLKPVLYFCAAPYGTSRYSTASRRCETWARN